MQSLCETGGTSSGGVDVEWLQGGLHYSLSYSTIGPDAPAAPDRIEQVKELARTVASRL